MNTSPFSTLHFTPAAGERALVLHGGGSADGRDAWLDVTEADLIIGTSAGPTAARPSATSMRMSTRPPAARAGYDQGRARAGQLTEFWR